MITVKIDGRPVEVEKGTTVLHAAQQAGIEIPTLCYLEDVLADGSCRICVVEIESRGRKSLDTACTAMCNDGDVISTKSPTVIETRRKTLDLLLSDHKIECFSCAGNGACKLQDLCYEYRLYETSYSGEKNSAPIDDTNEFFAYDPGKCILCHRCVNTCHEIVGRGAIDTMNRGFQSVIGAPFDTSWSESDCESCGNCVQACPTGALTMKRRKNYCISQIEKKVLTTCPHCAAGCQYELIIKKGQIVDTRAADGPSNKGLLCAKGRNTIDFVHSPDRILYPMIKDQETGEFARASYEQALELAAAKFAEIRKEAGADALAAVTDACATNEEMEQVKKLAETCFGAKKAELSNDLPAAAPVTDHIRKADVILLAAADPEKNQPVIGMQIRQAVLRGASLIFAGTSDSSLVQSAALSLPLKAGTEAAFVNGLMNVICSEGLQAEGAKEPDEAVKAATPEKTAEICGIDAEDLKAAARLYAKAGFAPILCGSCADAKALYELAALTGQTDAGVTRLLDACNARGASDLGAPLAAPAGAKGLYVLETDPQAKKVLPGQTEFLLVQSLFMSEAAKQADVILPAMTFAEKDGTVISTEHRVQHFRKAVDLNRLVPEADLRPATDVIADLMERIG